MADRFVLKQFAGSATNNGAFGAAQATGAGVQPVANIKDVQSLNAFEQGWNSATLTADKLPALEEMQGLEALLCKAIKELYSEGIPLWISGETYYQHSFVNYNGVIYYNTTGSYTANNPAIDTANWSEYKRLGTATVGNETTPIYLNGGLATPCKQTAITVYDNTKTYYEDEVVMTLDTNNNVKLYKSLANNNTSALSDVTKWEEVSLVDGAVLGQLANKADIDLSNLNNTGNVAASNLNSKGIRTVVDTYANGTSWYRIWSDGWIEQGGIVAPTLGTIQFLKPYSTSSYTVMLTPLRTDTSQQITAWVLINSLTTTSFDFAATPTFTANVFWRAEGY